MIDICIETIHIESGRASTEITGVPYTGVAAPAVIAETKVW